MRLKSEIFSAVDLSRRSRGRGRRRDGRGKEKWTFIPIPSAYFGSDGWSAGLVLLEYNFLGLRKTLVVGGTDSNLGLLGLLAYSDPRFLHTKTSFRVFADAGRADKGRPIHERRHLRVFQGDDGGQEASASSTPRKEKLNRRARPHTPLFRRGRGRGAAYGLYENSPRLHTCRRSSTTTGGSTSATGTPAFRRARPTSMAFACKVCLPTTPILGNAEMDFPVFLGGYLEVGAAGRYGDGEFQSLGSLSGPGYRTLPYQYSFSPRDAASYANLALPLIKLGWSTMELGPFYEAGVYATGPAADTTLVFPRPGLPLSPLPARHSPARHRDQRGLQRPGEQLRHQRERRGEHIGSSHRPDCPALQ